MAVPWTATTTFSHTMENHAGMQQIGVMSEHGHSLAQLREMREAALAVAKERGISTSIELYQLNVPEIPAAEALNAYVLVVRNGAALLLGGAEHVAPYEAELRSLQVDKQALMRGRVVNKHARWNLCFDEEPQAANVAAGQGTIVAFRDVPYTNKLRTELERLHPTLAHIKAEYNDYYDVSKCGIGYHGDTERKEVIAVRTGTSLPLYYQWFHRSLPVGPRLELPMHGGDLYVMSEKAVGTDWKKSSQFTLRHATGCDKFTVLSPPQPTVRLAPIE